jgi:hypothetical protein
MKVWGNSLRNALVRSRSANISLAANPTQTARPMVNTPPDHHPQDGCRSG